MITFEEENNEKCFNYSLALGVSQSHTQTVWGVFFFAFFVENFGDLFCSLCEHDIVGTFYSAMLIVFTLKIK